MPAKTGFTLPVSNLMAMVPPVQLPGMPPGWPSIPAGEPDPPRPNPDDPPFHRSPLAPTFEERRRFFLEWLTRQPPQETREGIWGEVGRLELGPGPVNHKILREALDFVHGRHDCSDFTVAALLRLYYKHAGDGKLTPEQREAIRNALLGFRYWLTEPNPTLCAMELWTENHQILAHTAEYLAGQLFPDDIFTNNGWSGRQRMEHARPKIWRWVDWRSRVGFAEWDSNPYYPEDLAALLNLIDFARDEELVTRAAMLVDLLLFDVAVDSFYGQYGTSHGRIYAQDIKSAAGDRMLTVQALLWGLGRFQSSCNMGAVSLATSQGYRPPPVLEAVALDMPPEMINRERHSIEVTREEASRYGLTFTREEDLMIWWAMGAFTHPKIIAQTLKLADKWGLWHYNDFAPFKTVGKVFQRLGLLPLLSAVLDPDPNGVLMSQVNKLTYRTPEYMLSCAQDYRKGGKGYQQHIWQATLGPYAVVFVTNPDSLLDRDQDRPSYWASNGRLPRAGQYRNLLICIFNLPRRKGLLETRHFLFTHAYFPRWAFDEVVEVAAPGGGGWICGRKGEGYVALYSHLPYRWQEEGVDAGQAIIVPGRRNIWICQCGSRSREGSFEQFVEQVTRAPLQVKGLHLRYEAPGLGPVSFGWKAPFKVRGEHVPLRGYPRWDNPYCRAEFGSRRYVIAHEGYRLEIDFETGRRLVDGVEWKPGMGAAAKGSVELIKEQG